MYSLFIGRYQPFHDGHKALIETVLKEGKNVCIAIRATKKSEANPYTAFERILMIETALKKWMKNDKVVTIIIPDIAEVCYGRKVGWGIREIKLASEIEKISGTALRGAKP